MIQRHTPRVRSCAHRLSGFAWSSYRTVATLGAPTTSEFNSVIFVYGSGFGPYYFGGDTCDAVQVRIGVVGHTLMRFKVQARDREIDKNNRDDPDDEVMVMTGDASGGGGRY